MNKKKDTVSKVLRLPIEINAKVGMKVKHLRSEGEKIKIPDLIVRMIKPEALEEIHPFKLDDDMYVIKSLVHIPKHIHAKIKVQADKYKLTDEMYIINLLNKKINE